MHDCMSAEVRISMAGRFGSLAKLSQEHGDKMVILLSHGLRLLNSDRRPLWQHQPARTIYRGVGD